MELLEVEAKKILENYSIEVPPNSGKSYVVKAQVLSKNRKAKGGVKFAENLEDAKKKAETLQQTEIDGQKPEKILVEEKIDIAKEYYLSFIYDTICRSPTLIFSRDGGTGVEKRQTQKMQIQHGNSEEFEKFLEKQDLPEKEAPELCKTITKLFKAFQEEDAKMLEINPLALTPRGSFVAVDAKMELDSDARFRHKQEYPERTGFKRAKTLREKKAEKIDENDHRGVAGKYTELDGNIGMMLAGGGASLTNMDAVIAEGLKPANYTEYGGNPPTEKVYKLSKVIMSKPGLEGLLHVGGTANNTDIYRTMKGFCQALEELTPDYPIVVRRDGPNADKAFQLLEETRDSLDLNMQLYRNDLPMTEASEKLLETIEEQKK